MNGNDRDDEMAEILDARAGQPALTSAVVELDKRPELRGLLEAADVAWASCQVAPPLAADPVAAMLGLVPDLDMVLDGKALSTARKSAGMAVSALAQRLAARGWEISQRDVFAWESGKNLPRVPALIRALAEETGVNADRIRRSLRVDPERAKFADIVSSEAFKKLAQRWARVQGTTVAFAASALESRLLVAVHRGGAPDTDVLLESLEAVVSAVEDTDRS